MKIELVISHVDRQWLGIAKIEDDFFKVTLWPGSATEPWKALLVPTIFVELTPGGKIEQAILLEYRKWRIGELMSRDDYDVMLKAVDDHPELLDEIELALRRKEEVKSNDSSD